MSTTQFPAGLTDLHYEVFVKASEIYVLNNGKTLKYADFPASILAVIDQLMIRRPKAMKALDLLGLASTEARRKMFINCNLANFDFTADVSENLESVSTEYVNCSIRGKCDHEGKLCSPVQVGNEKLSIRELNIMGKIRNGLFDKEIAETLFISAETVKTTKRNIQRKLQIERKAMIANVAATMQIN